MIELLSVLGLMLCALLLLMGFRALDTWHKRKAWREAAEFARRYMEERHGWTPPPPPPHHDATGK